MPSKVRLIKRASRFMRSNDIDCNEWQRLLLEMATTVQNGNDCFDKWQRLFQITTAVSERENCSGASFLKKLRKGFELCLWRLTVDNTFYLFILGWFSWTGMVSPDDLNNILNAMRDNKSRVFLRKEVEKIRTSMNPHPANQKTMNVPRENGKELPGMQHKYRETVLFFPSEGIALTSKYLAWFSKCVHTFQLTSLRSA